MLFSPRKPVVMKPISGAGPIGGIGGGNPPAILRARVVNILPSGVIMVNLLAKPADKNLRSTGPLTGPKPIDINILDLVEVRRTRSGMFEFVRIAEKAVAFDHNDTPDYPIAEAVPTAIETAPTEEHRIVTAPRPAAPPPAVVPEISGVYHAFPSMLNNTVELLGAGKRLKRAMIQQPSAEIRAKALRSNRPKR